MTLFTSYDRVAATTVLRQFPPGEIIISLDVDLIGRAQTSDSSLLCSTFPLSQSSGLCTGVQKGTSRRQRLVLLPIHVPHHSVEKLGSLGCKRKFREESTKLADISLLYQSKLNYNTL